MVLSSKIFVLNSPGSASRITLSSIKFNVTHEYDLTDEIGQHSSVGETLSLCLWRC